MCFFEQDENGLDPKTCFYLYDTFGKKVLGHFKSNDSRETQRLIWGKQLVNMTIKMWVDSMREGCLTWFEVREYTQDMPDWVYKSIENQYYSK